MWFSFHSYQHSWSRMVTVMTVTSSSTRWTSSTSSSDRPWQRSWMRMRRSSADSWHRLWTKTTPVPWTPSTGTSTRRSVLSLKHMRHCSYGCLLSSWFLHLSYANNFVLVFWHLSAHCSYICLTPTALTQFSGVLQLIVHTSVLHQQLWLSFLVFFSSLFIHLSYTNSFGSVFWCSRAHCSYVLRQQLWLSFLVFSFSLFICLTPTSLSQFSGILLLISVCLSVPFSLCLCFLLSFSSFYLFSLSHPSLSLPSLPLIVSPPPPLLCPRHSLLSTLFSSLLLCVRQPPSDA